MSEESEVRVHKAQVNPDIDRISSLNLYEGQRVKHELLYGVVKDRKTGAFHHDYVTFKTLRKTKATPWKADPKASFTLSDDKAQEMTKALDFLATCRGMPMPQAIPVIEPQAMEHASLIAALADLDAQDRLEIVLRLIRDLRSSQEPRQVMYLIEQIDDTELEATARLFQIGVWRKVLREFHALLRNPDAVPGDFRAHFGAHPWQLGSEASEALPLEPLHLASAADLLLYRTPDDWIELLVVRTPLAEPRLFHGDDEKGWFPVPELSMAISRTQLLLEKLTPDALMLDSEWTLQGCRARILIGHLQADPVQERVLQRFNRHARHIEVLSYDMIDRHAIKALKRLQQAGR